MAPLFAQVLVVLGALLLGAGYSAHLFVLLGLPLRSGYTPVAWETTYGIAMRCTRLLVVVTIDVGTVLFFFGLVLRGVWALLSALI